MVLAIRRDIDRKLSVDEWKRVVLSSPVQFQEVEESEEVWVATCIRETVGAQFETVYYTNVQRIFQVMALKSIQEKLNGKRATLAEVAKLYNSKVVVSSGEAVSLSFIDSSTCAWEYILKPLPMRKIIVAVPFQMCVLRFAFGSDVRVCVGSTPSTVDFELTLCCQVEEYYGKKSPFDSVYKLEHAVRKADKEPTRIEYGLIGIVDCCLNLKVLPQEITVTNLTGKGRGNKGPPYRSLVDTIRQSPAKCTLQLFVIWLPSFDSRHMPASQPTDHPTNCGDM
jgi:hypothetical protein